jgi:hypothetical protein
MAKRCRGRLHLENIGGLLVRREGFIHGRCPDCKEPVQLRHARRFCNRIPKCGDRPR